MYGNPYYAPYQYPYFQNNGDFRGQAQQPIQNINQPIQTPQTANMAQKNDMLWVLNKNEADSYPVAPNCSVVLWDKNSPTIYIKSMSANGVPSMRTLDFTERTETAANASNLNANIAESKYATLEQLNKIQGEIDGLRNELDKIAVIETTEPVKEEKIKNTTKKTKGGGDNG